VSPALSVVLPVYNEAALVRGVVEEWIAELGRLGISYQLLIYDDGSTDDTPRVLDQLAAEHAVVSVRRHANRGHGPSILRGYREAEGEWVFQADSDGEMEIGAFRMLWVERDTYDFLLGRRVDRTAPLTRRIITWGSRVIVRLAFGRGIEDVNSPFRLMRAARLGALLTEVPEDAFAPNVILSGLAVRRRLRVYETPVGSRQSRTAPGSLRRFKALRLAARSLRETLAVAVRARQETR
jgi:glycosyltransferase involved in cell wall biosynthesis